MQVAHRQHFNKFISFKKWHLTLLHIFYKQFEIENDQYNQIIIGK